MRRAGADDVIDRRDRVAEAIGGEQFDGFIEIGILGARTLRRADNL